MVTEREASNGPMQEEGRISWRLYPKPDAADSKSLFLQFGRSYSDHVCPLVEGSPSVSLPQLDSFRFKSRGGLGAI